MQHVDRLIGVAAVTLSALAFSACSVTPVPQSLAVAATPDDLQPAVTVAPHPPPPRRAEIPPAAPSPQALWRFGRWRWDGRQYVWLPGEYIQRPSPSANWRPGYWQEGPDGWMWVEGQWTS
jgi:WXXGXW repeat (2 copies)